MSDRLFIFLGAGNGAVPAFFDRQSGGFGTGRWRVVAWEPARKHRRKLRRTLEAFRQAGATVELLPERATTENFPKWLADQPETTILLAANIGGDETEIFSPGVARRITQLYLATHGHRSKDHDWTAEERFLDRLRRETRLTIIN